MRCSLTVAVAALVCALGASAAAQLSNKEAPAIVGHFHLNVTSVEAHRKFWVDTLGGTADEIDGQDAIRFPDTVLILRVQPPTGRTRGTAFDHIGFAVPDVPALTTKVVANGYQLTTGREPVPGQAATAATGTAAPYGRFSYLLGPDGAKVELGGTLRLAAAAIAARVREPRFWAQVMAPDCPEPGRFMLRNRSRGPSRPKCAATGCAGPRCGRPAAVDQRVSWMTPGERSGSGGNGTGFRRTMASAVSSGRQAVQQVEHHRGAEAGGADAEPGVAGAA